MNCMKLTCLCAATACCLGLTSTVRAQETASKAPTHEPAAKPAQPATQQPPVSPFEPVVPGLAGSDEQAGGVKGFLSRINSDAEGLTPRAGSIVPGGGLALGGHYRQAFANRNLFLDAEYLMSTKQYHSTSFGISSRPLFDGRMTVGVGVRRDTLPEEDFYGLGPDSTDAFHTSYSRLGTHTSGWMAYKPRPGLELKSSVGFINTRLSRGEQSGLPSIEERFVASSAEGISRESDYLRLGFALSLDRRDSVKYTRRGSYYQAAVYRYMGFGDGDAGFFRVDVDARRYVPVRGFSGEDSIALRGALSFTDATSGDNIPFYFLPRLGGSNLRGYDTSRFIDRHSALVNVEYRWQLRKRLQIVGFVDAGQVAPSFSDFAANRFQTAFGAGVRYRGFRFDYAVGRDGSRFHVGFGPSF
jgi:outer membrane protein assembly factor BamA